MKSFAKSTIKFIHGLFTRPERVEGNGLDIRDILIIENYEKTKTTTNNPLAKFGSKCFSQADEDGITLEIIKRLGLGSNGQFCEFGVGDGMENNTLALLAMGWKGCWVGNDTLKFNPDVVGSRLKYLKKWVTKENIIGIAKECLATNGTDNFDLISLDFDGNDIYFVEELLANNIKPSVFIVEYNAQFPPPIRFAISYDPTHTYSGDDYFGASLQSYDDLFRSHGYTLVCCNLMTGANAFFVKNEFIQLFTDVPKDIQQIYAPPRYFLPKKYGYKHSPKTVEALIGKR